MAFYMSSLFKTSPFPSQLMTMEGLRREHPHTPTSTCTAPTYSCTHTLSFPSLFLWINCPCFYLRQSQSLHLDTRLHPTSVPKGSAMVMFPLSVSHLLAHSSQYTNMLLFLSSEKQSKINETKNLSWSHIPPSYCPIPLFPSSAKLLLKNL